MPRYEIEYYESTLRRMTVEAESESAARQAWIDSDGDGDVEINSGPLTIESIREVG